MALTDVAEGTIVRAITRLDETCREVRDAARVIGDAALMRKMEDAQMKIKRDSEYFTSHLVLLSFFAFDFVSTILLPIRKTMPYAGFACHELRIVARPVAWKRPMKREMTGPLAVLSFLDVRKSPPPLLHVFRGFGRLFALVAFGVVSGLITTKCMKRYRGLLILITIEDQGHSHISEACSRRAKSTSWESNSFSIQFSSTITLSSSF